MAVIQIGLFDHRRYPRKAGNQMRVTSLGAAKKKKDTGDMHYRIIALLRCHSPLSAREIAEQLGEDEDNIRPRCSELASTEMDRQIEDSGEKHPSRKGMPMIAWRLRA